MNYKKIFTIFAEKAALGAGTPIAFILAFSFVVIWMIVGPLSHYSRDWELTITILPAIVTFLLVFLIQNSQNREILAVQLKLNELIRATKGAHTVMVNLEKLTEEELLIIWRTI